MARPPRPPSSGLLDSESSKFILATGAFKGGLGIALLLLLPTFGFGLIVTQTVIFLYESIGKLVSAYPARRTVSNRPKNWVLHISILAGIALQVATVMIPGLRQFLRLDGLDARGWLVVAVAVVATWGFAALTRAWVERRTDARLATPAAPVPSPT